jgi:hypothetical protein
MKFKSRKNVTRWQSLTFILIIITTAAFLARRAFAADGDLDTSFASPNGFRTIDDLHFSDVVIQPDGKIVAAGWKTEEVEIEDQLTTYDLRLPLLSRIPESLWSLLGVSPFV